jgi:lysophospholipase L1-like esterase
MRILFILLITTLSCEAQLKGSFVYPTEDNLNGCVLYWDLDDPGQITTSGGLLVQLNDKGTGGNNVIPASEGVRPSYFSSGGPNNKGYVEVPSGKTFQNLALSLTTSPFTLYAVIKLPNVLSSNATILSLGTAPVLDYVTSSDGGVVRISGGTPEFFSGNQPLINRTDWQLVKIVVKDNNSYWAEINQEPPGYRLDKAGMIPMATVTRLAFNYPGIKVASVRLYDRQLSDRQDSVVRVSMMQRMNVTTSGKVVVLLGDSHTAGTMSGTNVLGPYAFRLASAHVGQVINHATGGTVVNRGTFAVGFSTQLQAYQNLTDRMPVYCKAKFASTYVVLQYGTNDAIYRGSAGMPTRTEWQNIYKDDIQDFLDLGFPANHIIVCTPPYASGGAAGVNLPIVVGDIRDIVTEKGVVLCDFYDAIQTAGQNCASNPDTIHCNDTQHTIMLNLLESILFP